MALINKTYGLSQIEFIGGTTQLFDFVVYDFDGNSLNLDGSTCTLKIRDYGDYGDEAVLSKDGVITDSENGKFRVTLENEDTEDLFGKFVYQPTVIDFKGQVFIPSQGILVILKSIK